MPANWFYGQHVVNGRVEWPIGPITGVTGTFKPTWVDAWVVQGGGPDQSDQILAGPSQSTSQSSWSGFEPIDAQGNGYWLASERGWKSGRFQAGTAAVGISLLALRDNAGNVEYDWWFQAIILY